MKNLDKASVTRLVLAILAAGKLILEPFGIEIPQELADSIANAAGALFVVYAAWKNNAITKQARKEKQKIKELKEEGQI